MVFTCRFPSGNVIVNLIQIMFFSECPQIYRHGTARNLDKLQNYRRDVTFEEFACELMSPSLINFDAYKGLIKFI